MDDSHCISGCILLSIGLESGICSLTGLFPVIDYVRHDYNVGIYDCSCLIELAGLERIAQLDHTVVKN